MHLAELNIARLRHDADDPRVAPFMKALDTVNGIAERSPGFVWRMADDIRDGDVVVADNTDPRMIVNLSVWQDVETLEAFVWNTIHRKFFQRRDEWFEILERMHFCMWWVEPGHAPTVTEAMERLTHFNQFGNTDNAFDWRHLPQATLWQTARDDRDAAETRT